MFKITYDQTDQRVRDALRAKGPRIIGAVVRKMNEFLFLLQAKIVGEKLQGQVLEHRTGKLAGSIRVNPVSGQGGSNISGSIEGAGGPAWYGKLHEDGGTFPYHRKKQMAERMTNKGAMRKRVLKGSITFPERSFMRSSLNEMRQQIFDGLTQTIKEEL